MNTRSRFILLVFIALGVLCDADAQKLRGMKARFGELRAAQMFGGAMSPLDAVAQASMLNGSQTRPTAPALNNLLGRRLLVPQQYATIQTAIDSAVHGDTVLVSDGTYYENIRFKGKRIVVASTFITTNDTSHISRTIINGSRPTNPDSGSVVYFISGEDTNSVLYGLTITGGTGTVFDPFFRVGGGIYLNSSAARISHNRIVSNQNVSQVSSRGGGIAAYPFGNAFYTIVEGNLIESNFVQGTSRAQGAGVYLPHGRIVANVISRNRCQAEEYALGGGTHSASDPSFQRRVDIVGNTITDNEAVSTASFDIAARGGGVDTYGGVVIRLVNNTIKNNRASSVWLPVGGGVDLAFANAPSIVQGNTISSNSVTAHGGGAGLELYETQGVQIMANRFEGNDAPLTGWGGGGIDETYCTGNLIAGNLIKNNRSGFGGGVFAFGSRLVNNIIAKNRAHWGGGIVCFQNTSASTMHLINNTIAENVADTAGAMATFSSTTIVAMMNTILWGNTAPRGPEIEMWGGTLNAAYSDVRFGRDSIAIDSAATINWLPGNITSNPQFRDTTMRLANSSPCIGAAIDSMQIGGVWLHAPRFCFYGSQRPNPSGSRPDIGACENPNGPPEWQLQTTLSGNPPLYGICTVSDRVAWIGSLDTVYRTTNSGTNWIPTPASPTSISDIAYIEALSADTAFIGGGGPGAAGGNARIYRTTNGGQTWSIVYTAPGTMSYWNAIHFFDTNNAIAMSDPPNPGERFLIIKSTDAGTTWTPIANQPIANAAEAGLQNMYFYDRFNGWFGTTGGRVFRTTDGGDTWAGFPSGNTGYVGDVLFISPMVGIRISYNIPFLTRSTDGGQTWTPVTSLPVANIAMMYCATSVNTPNGRQLWVDGLTIGLTGQFMITSTDGGATWLEQTLPVLQPGHLPRLSAVSFGDSVQIFGGSMHLFTGSPYHGGEILSYRQKIEGPTMVEDQTTLPTGYSLSQNYPNPFNPSTTINYQLPTISHVTLKVFDILGREVATLVDEVQEAGYHNVQWSADNLPAGRHGGHLSSGVYLYRLQAGSYSETKKLVVLR